MDVSSFFGVFEHVMTRVMPFGKRMLIFACTRLSRNVMSVQPSSSKATRRSRSRFFMRFGKHRQQLDDDCALLLEQMAPNDDVVAVAVDQAIQPA